MASGSATGSRLVVLGLPPSADSADVVRHFSTHDGTITDAKVMRKKDGSSRCFAFLGYANPGEAAAAKEWFDGTWFDKFRIRIDYARQIDAAAERPAKRQRRDASPHGSNETIRTAGQVKEDSPSEDNVMEASSSTTLPSGTSPASEKPVEAIPDDLTDAEYLAMRAKRHVGAQEISNEETDTPQTTERAETVPIEDEPTSRLFVRNLAYSVGEDDLRSVFEIHGPINEIRVLRDTNGTSKGLAYIGFSQPEYAQAARSALDRTSFKGRLLHILEAWPQTGVAEVTSHGKQTGAELTREPERDNYRAQKKAKRLDQIQNENVWRSLYLNSDAVLEVLSKRFQVDKATLLAPESSNAAAQMTLAETMFLRETRQYLEENGVNVDALDQPAGQEPLTVILKNLPPFVQSGTIKSLLSSFGSPNRIIVPPSGLIAVVQFLSKEEAASALKGLAYAKLGSTLVYTGKAPQNIWNTAEPKTSKKGAIEDDEEAPTTALINQPASARLHVSNISFTTTQAKFAKLFSSQAGFKSASLAKKPGQENAGYGFVEFDNIDSSIQAQSNLNGALLDGKLLNVQFGKTAAMMEDEQAGRGTDAKVNKVVIKNLPFEATKADLRRIMSPFGDIMSLRLPRKADSSLRGFAFVQYRSSADAKAAITGLKDVHLLGRRLIVQYASDSA